MRKTTVLAVLLLVLPLSVQAGVISGTFDRISVVQEFGVGIPANDNFFRDDWKPAIHAAPRVEFYVGKGISVYTGYTFSKFDVVSEADSNATPIDASAWTYGAMVQGNLNTFGSVVGYLELGTQKSISPTEPNEWQFWQGLAARFYCTAERGTFIDLGLRYKPLGDSPVVEELLPRIAFGVGL